MKIAFRLNNVIFYMNESHAQKCLSSDENCHSKKEKTLYMGPLVEFFKKFRDYTDKKSGLIKLLNDIIHPAEIKHVTMINWLPKKTKRTDAALSYATTSEAFHRLRGVVMPEHKNFLTRKISFPLGSVKIEFQMQHFVLTEHTLPAPLAPDGNLDLSGGDFSWTDFKNDQLYAMDVSPATEVSLHTRLDHLNTGSSLEMLLSILKNLNGPLAHAILSGCNFTGTDLSNIVLIGADLSGTDCTGAKMRNTWLSGVKLIGAKLRGADLTGADLTGADLTGADLTDANLTGARLSGAILKDTNLTRTILTDAWLAGIRFITCTTILEYPGANLCNAQLDGTIFIRTNLSGTILSGVLFQSVDFSNAKLIRTDLDGAIFFHTTLAGSDFTATDLSFTTFIGSPTGRALMAGATFYRTKISDLSFQLSALQNHPSEKTDDASLDKVMYQNFNVIDVVQNELKSASAEEGKHDETTTDCIKINTQQSDIDKNSDIAWDAFYDGKIESERSDVTTTPGTEKTGGLYINDKHASEDLFFQ